MYYRIGTVVGRPVLGLAAPWSPGGEARPTGPAAIDVNAVREKVSPGTCQVTVLNGWGVPVAYANGFLLGQGRFVLTDLGAVGQPGVSSVSLKFQNGPVATAKEFGLAHTATGLVALRVEAEAPSRTGLELAPEAPPVDAGPMTAARRGRGGRSNPCGRLLSWPRTIEYEAFVSGSGTLW